ncbi:MAG: TlpA disulfide reductase family protein [Candidatus Omnitrophota bacterium]|nr:TlpA disulfide reductase family protein [Candidatus Omnitrophota bacterium]
MKKIIICAAIILLSLSAALAIQPLTKTGGLAIDFNLPDTNGNQVSLSSYAGKQQVLIVFWTTWCPFCRDALKKIEKMSPELKKNGWEMLAVNVGESAPTVNNFLKSVPLSFKVLLDADQDMAQVYEVMGVPTYLIIDKNGIITFRDNYFPEEKLR